VKAFLTKKVNEPTPTPLEGLSDKRKSKRGGRCRSAAPRGSEWVVVPISTSGPAAPKKVLREALAKGADPRPIHLEDEAFVAWRASYR